MSEPVTAAGRALLDCWGGLGLTPDGYDPTLLEWSRRVLAIFEAEARARTLDEVEAEVKALYPAPDDGGSVVRNQSRVHRRAVLAAIAKLREQP